MSVEQHPLPHRSPFARAGWVLVGLVAVVLGGVGIVVPGMPATVFFVIAVPLVSNGAVNFLVTLSVVVFIGAWPLRLAVLTLGAIGVAYIALRVPTRERVLEPRSPA